MKKNLEKLMKEYLQILLPYVNDQTIPAYLEGKLHALQADIIEILLFNADRPIFISDKNLKDIFNKVIHHILNPDDRQFLHELFDKTGIPVSIICNYLDRFLNLKPLLLISNLPEKVNALLSDAIRSYFYGCNRAAVILCGTLLEESLKEKLLKIDESLVHKRDNSDRPTQLSMPVIIDNAISNNVLDATFEKKAKYTVNKERNNAVHHSKLHNSKEALRLSEGYLQAREAIAKAASIGSYIVSDETATALEKLLLELEKRDPKEDLVGSIANNYESVKGCIIKIREYSKTDLLKK